jgi:hypothetical protein
MDSPARLRFPMERGGKDLLHEVLSAHAVGHRVAELSGVGEAVSLVQLNGCLIALCNGEP